MKLEYILWTRNYWTNNITAFVDHMLTLSLFLLASAPEPSSCLTIASSPRRTAVSRGVSPFAFAWSTFAPLSHNVLKSHGNTTAMQHIITNRTISTVEKSAAQLRREFLDCLESTESTAIPEEISWQTRPVLKIKSWQEATRFFICTTVVHSNRLV